MGASLNKPRIVRVRGSYYTESTRAVPLYTYSPFPEHWNRPAGSLITRVKAVPDVKEEENDLYWWSDCEFLPNNDSAVVTTCSAYSIQSNQALTSNRAILPGKVCLFDLSSEKHIKCGYYRQASVASCPKLQTFPDGDHIVYVDSSKTDIKVMSLQRSEFHSRAKDIYFRAYKYVSVSPGGSYFAIVARCGRQYQLLIYDSSFVTRAESVIDCYKLSDYGQSRLNFERTACKWSPDSGYVAVAILPAGHLSIVSRRTQACVCNVFDEAIPGRELSRETAFDFDPMSSNRIISVGGKNRFLYIVDLEKRMVRCQTETVCGKDAIDIVKFTCDGLLVGVALGNFMVKLYSPDNCSVIYSFSMKDSLPSLQTSPAPHASILNLVFSSTGEQAVTSTSDGYVSFWQLPRKIDLQVICKYKILSCVSLNQVSKLPLPPRLKDFLLSLPTKV